MVILAALAIAACSKGVKTPGNDDERQPAPQRSDPSEYPVEKQPATLEAADIEEY